jgi:hypothetical protein
MSPALEPLRQLVQQGRAQARALLAGIEDPHTELLALVWGPRFDRQPAMGLWARLSQKRPVEALPLLPALLGAADRFDDLDMPRQHRLRRLILRHRAMQPAAV